jgi:hypothetical protein
MLTVVLTMMYLMWFSSSSALPIPEPSDEYPVEIMRRCQVIRYQKVREEASDAVSRSPQQIPMGCIDAMPD